VSLQVKKSRTQGQSLASVGLSKSLFVSIVDTAIALCVEVGFTISGYASSVNEGKTSEFFFTSENDNMSSLRFTLDPSPKGSLNPNEFVE